MACGGGGGGGGGGRESLEVEDEMIFEVLALTTQRRN